MGHDGLPRPGRPGPERASPDLGEGVGRDDSRRMDAVDHLVVRVEVGLRVDKRRPGGDDSAFPENGDAHRASRGSSLVGRLEVDGNEIRGRWGWEPDFRRSPKLTAQATHR